MRADRRSHCPISLSLEVIGDRWSLLILRDLVLFGKRRYGELLASEEAIATNILASRLAKLRKAGLISKSMDEKRQTLYVPTQKALDLKPVLTELARWGLKYDRHARVPTARLG